MEMGPAAMKKLTEDSCSTRKFLGVSKVRNTIRVKEKISQKDYLRCCTKRKIHPDTFKKEQESCGVDNKYGKAGWWTKSQRK